MTTSQELWLGQDWPGLVRSGLVWSGLDWRGMGGVQFYLDASFFCRKS